MVLTKTPICNFGEKPHSFQLKGVDNKLSFKSYSKSSNNVGDKGGVL